MLYSNPSLFVHIFCTSIVMIRWYWRGYTLLRSWSIPLIGWYEAICKGIHDNEALKSAPWQLLRYGDDLDHLYLTFPLKYFKRRHELHFYGIFFGINLFNCSGYYWNNFLYNISKLIGIRFLYLRLFKIKCCK